MTSLGTMGTRPCAIAPLIRKRPSKAQHLSCIYEAGPCGSWLSRSLQKKGDDCWVVARSGARTPVYVPNVDDATIRDLTRAREDVISDLNDATFRRKACVLRQDIR